MGIDPALAATAEAPPVALPWPQAFVGPSGADRNSVCPEEWHPLGNVAPGNGMRLWDELLAPPPRLAGSRGLAEAS